MSQAALAIGASAATPIEIFDDPGDAEPAREERTGSQANNAIFISDSEDEDVSPSDNEVEHEPPVHPVNEMPEHALDPSSNQGLHDTVDDDAADELPERLRGTWPSRLPYWNTNRGLQNALFRDVDLGVCRCRAGECDNANSAVFCEESNCRAGALCGNRLLDCESLALIRCIKGMGVAATREIPPRTVVGEHCGYILTRADLTVEQRERGFIIKFKSRDTNGARVVIDAAPGGSLCRFVNHSCSPNSRFEEWQHRTTRKLAIVRGKSSSARPIPQYPSVAQRRCQRVFVGESPGAITHRYLRAIPPTMRHRLRQCRSLSSE